MLFHQETDRAKALVKVCQASLPGFVLGFLANKTRLWLNETQPPYKEELDEIAETLGQSAYSLNLSYEWGCTTTARNDDRNGGVQMYRALDWPITNMADKLVVADHTGAAGPYTNIAYPGFVGVLNGVARGRFAAAINSAPIPSCGNNFLIDMVLSKHDNFRHHNMPAPFLLRKVFEECVDFQQAVKTLAETPICAPATFSIAGINENEFCVIERMHHESVIHDSAKNDFVCAANHWNNTKWVTHDRLTATRKRHEAMVSGLQGYKGDFDWLKAPVMNSYTRLAFETNARTGDLKLVGVEKSRMATRMLVVQGIPACSQGRNL